MRRRTVARVYGRADSTHTRAPFEVGTNRADAVQVMTQVELPCSPTWCLPGTPKRIFDVIQTPGCTPLLSPLRNYSRLSSSESCRFCETSRTLSPAPLGPQV